MNITRRSFLIGGGAVALSAAILVPMAESEPLWVFGDDAVEYVRFMQPPEMWTRDWSEDFVKHQTVWRAGDKMYGLGVNVSKEDEVDGRVDYIMRQYNRALENTRRKHGFPKAMIRRGANSNEPNRWMLADGVWLRAATGIHPLGLLS